ncbi:MAG: hypothetical protein J1D86_07545, partial [Alistipes sp.]|nr:hypothetical protein [Alistipes sp.]
MLIINSFCRFWAQKRRKTLRRAQFAGSRLVVRLGTLRAFESHQTVFLASRTSATLTFSANSAMRIQGATLRAAVILNFELRSIWAKKIGPEDRFFIFATIYFPENACLSSSRAAQTTDCLRELLTP